MRVRWPLELHILERELHTLTLLGDDLRAGQQKQHIVPAHAWQAAVPRGDSWTLCACVVAPGFDFADFELPPREWLLRELPWHTDLVRRLTRAQEISR